MLNLNETQTIQLKGLLDLLADYFEDQADVDIDDYGRMQPNEEKVLLDYVEDMIIVLNQEENKNA